MKDKIIKIEPGDDLDLHHFHPKDAKDVLKEFIEMSYESGISSIRIAHGKGISVIKKIVIKELESNSKILSFHDDGSNWGATIAVLATPR